MRQAIEENFAPIKEPVGSCCLLHPLRRRSSGKHFKCEFLSHEGADRFAAKAKRLAGGINGAECVYKIFEEEQKVRTVYIIDVTPLTPVWFDEAVRRVYQLTRGEIDLMIYAGRLPFRPIRLIKVPCFLEPQKVRMTGKILTDVVLVEVAMADLNGVEVTRQIVKKYPSVKVIGISAVSDRRIVKTMMKAGAIGYLVKDSSKEELIQAVRDAAINRSCLSPSVADILME